ncbi:MAG: type II 3-dehydroquinate dehydratase [Anaeroplasmataceae bacterium]
MKTILVINGPNMNMLGKRDPSIYGSLSLNDIEKIILKEDYFNYLFYQSNHEGCIIDKIQSEKYDALIINPAAFTHTSIALRDCLEVLMCPKVEVHLSDVNNREDFRKINYIKGVCDKSIYGKKEQGYIEAIKYIKQVLC